MAAPPSFVQGQPAQWTCHLPFAGLIPSEPDSAFNCSSVGAPGCGEWLGEVGRLLHTACFSKDRKPLELFSKESFNEFRRCPSTHPLRFRGIAELGRCIGRLGGPEVGFHLGHILPAPVIGHHARLVNCWWAFSSLSKAAAIF